MEVSLLFDPLGVGLVAGGTIALTCTRIGWRRTIDMIDHTRTLLAKPFRMVEYRAKLARQVMRMQSDGVIRSKAAEVSDAEIADMTAALVKHRSTDALVAEHHRQAQLRKQARTNATFALEQMGELAPVMGLAGTLLALSQLPLTDLGGDGALMASVSRAVLSTFYGLMLAHLFCFPIGAAIQRRGDAEEEERDQLVAWLTTQLAPACPSGAAATISEPA